MRFFNFDLRRILTMAVLLAMPLTSIQLQQRSGKAPWIFQPFLYLSGSSQSVYSSFAEGVRDTTDLYLNLIQVKKQNRLLADEVSQIKLQLAELSELKLENERLSKLLNFKQRLPMKLVPVRIIGRDVISEYQSIVIDRGEVDGVKKGMAVINADGAIGYILHASSDYAFVMLLTDRYAVLDVLVQRSRARGVLGGQGLSDYELKYLKRNDDVIKGDKIITSGLDSIFPKGLLVGTVSSVEKSEFGFEQIVQLTPAVNADNLEEAFVVVNSQNFDFETIEATRLDTKGD